jgi:phage terminase small subunit
MNEKRRRFVEAYLTVAAGNATKAAEIAGYSAKTARQIGSKLLTFADVRQAVEKRQQQLAKRADTAADEWQAEVRKMAFANVELSERSKVKGLEMLGRHIGTLQPKEAKATSGITVNIGFISNPGVAELPQPVVITTHAIDKLAK